MENNEYVDSYVVKEDAGPKLCIARAIVSLGLGIFSCIYGVLSGLYVLYQFIFSGLTVLGKFALNYVDVDFPMGVFAPIWGIGTFIFAAISLAAFFVSRAQGMKFTELYKCESRMLKPAKITRTIGLIAASSNLALSVIMSLVTLIVSFI